MNDMEVQGQFVWGLGSSSIPATFTAFGPGEPNLMLNEDCMALYRAHQFDMADIPCDHPDYSLPVQLCYN